MPSLSSLPVDALKALVDVVDDLNSHIALSHTSTALRDVYAAVDSKLWRRIAYAAGLGRSDSRRTWRRTCLAAWGHSRRCGLSECREILKSAAELGRTTIKVVTPEQAKTMAKDLIQLTSGPNAVSTSHYSSPTDWMVFGRGGKKDGAVEEWLSQLVIAPKEQPTDTSTNEDDYDPDTLADHFTLQTRLATSAPVSELNITYPAPFWNRANISWHPKNGLGVTVLDITTAFVTVLDRKLTRAQGRALGFSSHYEARVVEMLGDHVFVGSAVSHQLTRAATTRACTASRSRRSPPASSWAPDRAPTRSVCPVCPSFRVHRPLLALLPLAGVLVSSPLQPLPAPLRLKLSPRAALDRSCVNPELSRSQRAALLVNSHDRAGLAMADAPRPAKRSRDADERQPEMYRVRVRGRDFELSREQVLAEGDGSFLASALLSRDWREGKERFIDLGAAHSPELFAIIAEHLAGYDVLPLERAPPTMSIGQATRNLLVMANYLDMPRLVARLEHGGSFEIIEDPALWVKQDPAKAPEGKRMLRCRLRNVVFQFWVDEQSMRPKGHHPCYVDVELVFADGEPRTQTGTDAVVLAGFAPLQHLPTIPFQGVSDDLEEFRYDRGAAERSDELKRPLGDDVPVRLHWHDMTVRCSLRQVFYRMLWPDPDVATRQSNPLALISWEELSRKWNADELVINAIATKQAEGPDTLEFYSIVALSASSLGYVLTDMTG